VNNRSKFVITFGEKKKKKIKINACPSAVIAFQKHAHYFCINVQVLRVKIPTYGAYILVRSTSSTALFPPYGQERA